MNYNYFFGNKLNIFIYELIFISIYLLIFIEIVLFISLEASVFPGPVIISNALDKKILPAGNNINS